MKRRWPPAVRTWGTRPSVAQSRSVLGLTPSARAAAETESQPPSRGLRVVTDGGRKLGQVDDLLLDSRTGEIRGYYVSIGKVLSVTQGLRWLPVETPDSPHRSYTRR